MNNECDIIFHCRIHSAKQCRFYMQGFDGVDCFYLDGQNCRNEKAHFDAMDDYKNIVEVHGDYF